MDLDQVGGTKGGGKTFLLGIALAGVSGWFFVDSVRVNSYGNGWISGGFGGFGGTGSMGVLFLPLLIGVAILFYDAKKLAGWVLSFLGIAIIGIEVLSRMRFFFDLKLSHLLMMLVGFAAGIGMIFRSLRADPAEPDDATSLTEMLAQARRQGAEDARKDQQPS